MSFAAPLAAGHRLEPVEVARLPGFRDDDLMAAFATFCASSAAIVAGQAELRPGKAADAGLRAVCRAALSAAIADPSMAAQFFETHFAPHRVVPIDGAGHSQRGFLTGYYEPVVAASPVRTADFVTPILARPADLESFDAIVTTGPLAGLAAARRRGDGGREPFPDRAAIEDGALGAAAQAVAWVRDPIERFLIQVQGSARLRWPDGSTARLVYSGRNGQPYTSIGRILVEEGHVPADRMSLAALKQWVRAQGQDAGAPGCALMRRNRSFVFFRLENAGDPAAGPIGAAGLPLTRLRSIAVDRTLWPYGLPFWIDADIPWSEPKPTPFRRLMVAQDTGSAIVGPARADIFFGSGDDAGARAGDIRHPGDFVVFLPAMEGRP